MRCHPQHRSVFVFDVFPTQGIIFMILSGPMVSLIPFPRGHFYRPIDSGRIWWNHIERSVSRWHQLKPFVSIQTWLHTLCSSGRVLTFGKRVGDFITLRVGRLYPRGKGTTLPKPIETAKHLTEPGKRSRRLPSLSRSIADKNFASIFKVRRKTTLNFRV